ncbi:hypothetical protein BDB00DRAFT_247532 [Zychaea mexicana]|uniref:uncharacterized protein n=1 Tax=Zychaea mexicana TaxID=64656 RepID=UPI0022FEB056|nr:uncharacterized protein BDB00DRAFT_247532 [Zychaea mexicana]KAI9495407.1 hypothetical protein BDB00DRAFT_247532 [Zychaea mexicana]
MNNVALSPLQLLLSSSTRAPAAHNNDHQYHDRDKQRYQHRYTDTCLFYPSALATRRKRRDGYMRRYSTSSIESSQTTVMANNTSTKSIHRKALSLSAFHQLQLGTTEQASKATIVSSIHNDHKLESSAVHQDHKHMTMGDSMTMATKTTNDACMFFSSPPPLPPHESKFATPKYSIRTARIKNKKKPPFSPSRSQLLSQNLFFFLFFLSND